MEVGRGVEEDFRDDGLRLMGCCCGGYYIVCFTVLLKAYSGLQ